MALTSPSTATSGVETAGPSRPLSRRAMGTENMKFKSGKSTVVLVPEDYFYDQLKRKSKARSRQLSRMLGGLIAADGFDDFIDDVVGPAEQSPPAPVGEPQRPPPKEPVSPTREVRVQLRKDAFKKAKAAAKEHGVDVSRLLSLVVRDLAGRT